MSNLDIVICLAYLGFTLVLGMTLSWKKSRTGTDDEYFLAGRTMRTWPAGMSVMVTAFSAINYLSIPSEVVGHGLYVTMAFPVFLLVAVPVLCWFIPFYHQRKGLSAYGFLEDVFDRKVRLLAAGMYVLIQLSWMALILYASGKMLALLTGFSQSVLILAIAGVSVIYVAVGGLRAVIWTDALQFIVVIGSVVLMLFIVLWTGEGELTANLVSHGALQPYYPGDATVFEFNSNVRMTVWSVTSGTLLMFLVRYGTDQAVLQRYAATRTLREAKRMFMINIGSALVCLMALTVLGLVLVQFASSHNLMSKPGLLILARLLTALPDGVSGLVVAGLLAATMSSIDSGINGIALTIRCDFQKTIGDTRPNSVLTRCFWNLAVGAAIVGLAFTIKALFSDKSIFSLIASVVNALGGALLMVVLAGMIHPYYRFSSVAVFAAGVFGFVFSLAFVTLVTGCSLHLYIVVNTVVSFVALLVFEVLSRHPHTNENLRTKT